MPIVIVAVYLVKSGLEEEVVAALREMAAQSRDEPGCLTYLAHRDPENPRRFLLYEQFADAGALAAHRGSAHFKLLVEGRVIPALEQQDVSAYEVLAA